MHINRFGQVLIALLVGVGTEPLAGAATKSIPWEPIGLSGGGAMFTPAISPADGKYMMVNCDMSGAYVSTDGGLSWRMINCTQLRSSTRCRPAFHPTQRQTIFAASGWSGLKVSHDLGVHWEPIGNLPHDLCGEIAIDPGKPELMLAGTSREVWRSTDAGKTWQKCPGPRGLAVSFHFDQTSPPDRRVCFAATADGIWRSDDGGSTWADKCAGLPWREIRAFSGGSNAATKQIVLYCAIPSKADAGRYAGGVFRSDDRGGSWQSAMGGGLNMDTTPGDQWAMSEVAQYHRVLTTNARPLTVYAFNANTGVRPPHHTAAYRSDDGGKMWRPTFQPDPRFAGCNVEQDYVTAGSGQFYQDTPHSLAIDPSDPEHILSVDAGQCYITENGGRTWLARHTRLTGATDPKSPDASWLCTGLVVTTTWNYYIDPFEANRHYICYTDIGFARSLDAAKRWKWWSTRTRSPWSNTCYELAFDPQTPGKIWGAFSNTHDIPNDNIISGRHSDRYPGGVCISNDFGASWKVCGTGLPAAPALSIVVDPKSTQGSRTLYASMFKNGVYKSTDDGKSWKKSSEGLGSATNMRVCRMQLRADGSLFVLITAMRRNGKFQPDGVGLYRSKDGAASWELVNKDKPLLWPKDFTVDPKDSRIIYIGAADAGGNKQGGLYRSTDAGANWALLVRKGPEHFGAYLHPKRPGWIYTMLTESAPESGLWLSKDNGATWNAMAGLPFANAQRIAFDPADDNMIYVTTFGGSVWRGPAEE